MTLLLLLIICYYLYSLILTEGLKGTLELIFVATLVPITKIYSILFKLKK